MRLLRVEDEQFVDFHDGCPPYAILSHTWREEEVSLQELQDSADPDRTGPKKKRGWSKIEYTIKQARLDGLKYVWIDTCCIDQRNPTELATSINSMFSWYSNADVCYVFLDDITKDPFLELEAAMPDQDFEVCISKARWTARGWTLQELIAPSSVVFYDSKWCYLTTRRDSANTLSTVTGIDLEVLTTPDSYQRLHNIGIATRMSWAAGRRTTRPEDRAYSLFGIFGVTMLTHYGEGERKACTRLQEEIIKSSTDQSIFAWQVRSAFDSDKGLLFAPSPDCFQGRGHIVPNDASVSSAYHLSNRGLEIDIHGYKTLDHWQGENSTRYQAILNCRSTKDQLSVFLLNLNSTGFGQYFISLIPEDRCEKIDWLVLQRRQKMQNIPRRKITIERDAYGQDLFKILARASSAKQFTPLVLVLQSRNLSICETYPPRDWCGSHCKLRFTYNMSQGVGAHLQYFDPASGSRQDFYVALAYDPEGPETSTTNQGFIHPDNFVSQAVPELVVVARDASRACYPGAGLEAVCSLVGSFKRFPKDTYLHDLPQVQTQIKDSVCIRVTLRKTDLLGERLLIAEVVASEDPKSVRPFSWRLVLSLPRTLQLTITVLRKLFNVFAVILLEPITFVVAGWDLGNIIESFETSRRAPGAFVFLTSKAVVIDLLFTKVSIARRLVILWAAIASNPATRSYIQLFYSVPNLDTLESPVDRALRFFMRISSYPKWELVFILGRVFHMFFDTGSNQLDALTDILRYTIIRDIFVLFASGFFLIRIFRVAAALVMIQLLQSKFLIPDLDGLEYIPDPTGPGPIACFVVLGSTILGYFVWTRRQLLLQSDSKVLRLVCKGFLSLNALLLSFGEDVSASHSISSWVPLVHTLFAIFLLLFPSPT